MCYLIRVFIFLQFIGSSSLFTTGLSSNTMSTESFLPCFQPVSRCSLRTYLHHRMLGLLPCLWDEGWADRSAFPTPVSNRIGGQTEWSQRCALGFSVSYVSCKSFLMCIFQSSPSCIKLTKSLLSNWLPIGLFTQCNSIEPPIHDSEALSSQIHRLINEKLFHSCLWQKFS